MAALHDGTLFLKSWFKQPLRIGALSPSGTALARLITREIRPDGGRVIELGPGTGVFTRFIVEKGLPEAQLTLVESNPAFATLLRRRYPQALVHEMDATRWRLGAEADVSAPVQAVISGLPLMNMSVRSQYQVLRTCCRGLGVGAALYQFTYMTRCPVAPAVLARLGLRAERIGSTVRNLPPAAVYRIAPC